MCARPKDLRGGVIRLSFADSAACCCRLDGADAAGCCEQRAAKVRNQHDPGSSIESYTLVPT